MVRVSYWIKHSVDKKDQDKWKMDHDKNYNFFEVENTLILDLFINLLLLQQDKQYQEKFHCL